tara:strand:+ start:3840 stop:4484 length:645 start_codon:yes stop_codon:yes gene_type:complete
MAGVAFAGKYPHFYGQFSDRPSAGHAGRFYHVITGTNARYVYFDDGVQWITIKVGTRKVFYHAAEFPVTTGNSGDMNSTGITGHSMTDGELSTGGPWPVPDDMDVTQVTDVKILWAPINGTTTQGVTFIVTYTAVTADTTTLVAPATALGTIMVEDDEDDTPYVAQLTAGTGEVAVNTFTAGAWWTWRVEADVVDSASDPGVWFLGLLLTYTGV